MTGARPAQGAATTTDVDYRLWDDWREAGKRRGHYNRCRLQAGGMTGARPAQGAATTTDVEYRLWDDWCEDYN